jgi:hypothetical protein
VDGKPMAYLRFFESIPCLFPVLPT